MTERTEDLVGTLVGDKYRILAKLGTGSMGVVYEAESLADQAHVALKVLRFDDADLVARFLREAKTMSLFQHPNIVELLEVDKLDDGRLFFAAELVRGTTLRAVIEEGPVEARRALAIMRQVLEALGHAHAMGVVHRDIKPENVMLDGTTVKILDFGVAKLVGDTPAVLGEGTLTITGYGALGTPYYMSPEAVLGHVVDARADLYAVGAVLFELLTGAPPYAHEDLATLMRMHAAAPIPVLAERAMDRPVTAELELLVSEALAKKPELRFPSAAEMIAAVDAATRSLELVPATTRGTDLFGALPMRPPAQAEPSASTAGAFAPAAIPSASQPVQPAAELPAPSAPPTTEPRAPTAPPAAPPSTGGVVAPGGHVPAPSGPLFAPPMPPEPPRTPRRRIVPPHLIALARQHRKPLAIIGGVVVLVIVIAIIGARGRDQGTGATTAATATEPRRDLARGAEALIAAGHPARAAELIEREDIGDDAATLLVLGHAQIGAGRRLDGLAAYERALALDGKHAADAQIRTNLKRVLDTRDAVAAVVALELALRLSPPARDLIQAQASTGKVAEVRRRALAIAEREHIADVDRVESASLDLAQAGTCEERLTAVLKLRRIGDPRALPALKRARTHRCVEREVVEAIAFLESRPAQP